MKRKSKIRAGWLRFFVLSFIFVFCSSMPAVAQNGIKITGKIVDNTQMEVIGANVLVKGTSIGAITDINGDFLVESLLFLCICHCFCLVSLTVIFI